MKGILVLAPVFALLSFQAFNQLDIKPVVVLNKSLTQPEMHLLYSGFDNELIIHTEDTISRYEISMTYSRVRPMEQKHTYLVAPPHSLKEDTLRILKNGVEIQQLIFSIQPLPSFTVQLGNINGNTASVKEMISEPTIHVFSSGYFEMKKKVISYEMIIESTDGTRDQSFGKTKGDKLLASHKEVIQALQPGDKVTINEILVVGSDHLVSKLKPYVLTITP